jgi:putative transposase
MQKLPVRLADREDAANLAELPEELRLAMADIASSAREGLLAMSVAVGLRVMGELLDAELATKVGAKGKHDPARTASRHGIAPGSVVLGGRRVPVDRPRARTRDGHEVQLDTYTAFAADDLLSRVVMEWMLAGLATRRHRAAGEPVGAAVEAEARATSKSAVSRRFVAQTAKALEALLGRDLTGLQVAALMVDGVCVAEHCCVVALAILADGAKLPVGLWLGDTENKTVVTHLLADLVDRGLDTTEGLLVVIDGAKALDRAVRKVFGTHALVNAAPSISGATSPTTCPRPSAAGWTPGSPRRSPTPIPTLNSAPPASWPGRCRPATLARPPACGRAWRRCSPSAGSAWVIGWHGR